MSFIRKKISGIVPPKTGKTLQQQYSKEAVIKDVVIVKTNVFADDYGGWFKEVVRLDGKANVELLKEQGVTLTVRQSNVSYLAAGAKRFWHIHPHQNEMWTTNSTLLVGLIDLRKKSSSYMVRQKVVLSTEKALFIPAGVAHGFINPNTSPVTLVYFADQQFMAGEKTEEYRVDPKDMSYSFVEPEEM